MQDMGANCNVAVKKKNAAKQQKRGNVGGRWQPIGKFSEMACNSHGNKATCMSLLQIGPWKGKKDANQGYWELCVGGSC